MPRRERTEEDKIKAREYSRQYKKRQRELYPEKVRAAAMRYYYASNGAAKAREQRKKNPEPYKQSVKRSYEKHRERYQGYTKAWKTALREAANTGDIAATQKYLHHSVRMRAKKDGIPYTLEPSDIPVVYVCPVFGTPLKANTGHARPDSFSLDKIVPALGYVPGNVQVLSYRANQAKTNLSIEELVMFARWVLKTYGGEN